jgi:hypothetical protein
VDRGVELMDLSDYEVLNKKLHCNSDNTDDKEVPNPEGMDVGDGARSCLQILGLDLGRATKSVPTLVEVHTEIPMNI